MGHWTRLLIADDDRRTRAGLGALLRTHVLCEIVGEAIDGQDTLAQVERCRPDAVLLDLHMPLLNGVQATRLIKARWPEIAIVVLSMDSELQSMALAAGADAFVSKADGPGQVVKTLQVVCGQGSAGAVDSSGEPAT
jgi:DNA-binding NarL/FixJ family response regulator